MTEFKVPYTTILDIQSHSNAERLSIATIYGFQVIIPKDRFQVGSKIIYIPVDSILTEQMEKLIFGPDSKIKLYHHRVRQIRLRGLASQGMVVDPKDVVSIVNPEYLKLEQDLAEILGVTKYEPPTRNTGQKPGTPRNKPLENPRFHKYNGVDNIKWFPSFFDNQEVIIQEKLHGSNCRAACLKSVPNTIWKKIKKLFGLLPEFEYCHGSNNVQLQERGSYKGFYGENVYGAVLKKVDAFNKIKAGETIFGELIGPGVQANYTYGLKEHHFVLFDVKRELEDGRQEYLDPEQVEEFAKERGFDFVPVLYRGIFNQALAKELSMGPSIYDPGTKVREGVVIKTRYGYGEHGDKKALKLISETYLDDKSNTDEH